jgi:predicted dehydrogenase/NADPH:quinone reductase-like Zn-dependent oxidoreductase
VLVQSLRSSSPSVVDSVVRKPPEGHVQIRSRASVISAGTERMLVSFAGSSLLGKARQQPERVAQVLDKARSDGVAAAIDSVRSRLDEPIALGYSQAGTVLAVGAGVNRFKPGDMVASLGGHAEIVTVPETLCARIPDGVSAEAAAFASLGAVALEGVRLAAPELGECFAVTGLGLIGLLAVQLLQAHGCRVLGVDPDPERRRRAEGIGVQTVAPSSNPVDAALLLSRGRGVDGVLLTAATTSSEPVHQAAQMCRTRGRIVLVGVTGLDLQRADFYEKELTLQVSCSSGPGRYDPAYEQRAIDYPAGYVRWTAGRNIEAVLDLIEDQRLDVLRLVTHRYPFDAAPQAYEALLDDPNVLAILLKYPESLETTARPNGLRRPSTPMSERSSTHLAVRGEKRGPVRIGVIGAGQFSRRVILPALRELGADIELLAGSGTGVSEMQRRFDITRVTGEPDEMFEAPDLDAIFILTRHDSHAHYVCRALETGKHVFVEKPLSIAWADLEAVIDTREQWIANRETLPVIGIGFNRRFAPFTRTMVEHVRSIRGPKAVVITVNAGEVPGDHWTRHPEVGGGRIIGEACHFIDLALYLTGSSIVDVRTTPMGGTGALDSAAITMGHEDGSVSSIAYLTNGSKRYVKEQISVFVGGRVLVNRNFRKLEFIGWPTARTLRALKQDKGHVQGVAAFLAAVSGQRDYPIPFPELVMSSAASLMAAERIQQ